MVFVLAFSLLIFSLPSCLCTTGSPPYILEYSRGRFADTLNLLTLVCTDTATAQPIPNAVFFRNGVIFFALSSSEMSLPERPIPQRVFRTGMNLDRILFALTRQAEGNYSCGVRQDELNFIRSPSLQFVAFPISSSATPPPSQSFFAKVGSQARVKCPQQPGQLFQQYFGRWRNISSGEVFAEIRSPTTRSLGSSPSSNPVSRYSIEAETFSLVVDNAMLSDSGNWYQCELEVQDPLDVNGRSFSYGASESQELLVYRAPIINVSPVSTVISVSEATATFNCRAEGLFSPIITWRHANRNITSRDTRYVIAFEEFDTSEGGRGSSSVLRLLNPSVRDTGEVECLADAAPSLQTNNLQLPGDAVSVPFTVLGEFDALDVFITTTQDVIFSLTFPVAPLHPVQLQFLYHEVGGAGRSVNVTPSMMYLNVTEMNYIAPDSSVPYDRFRVEIFLVHGVVVGPGRDTTLKYDKTEPSQVAEIIREAVLPSVLIPIILGILIISILIVTLYYLHRQKKLKYKHEVRRTESQRRKLEEDHSFELQRLNSGRLKIETDYKHELDTKKEDYQRKIAEMEVAHKHKIETKEKAILELELNHKHDMETKEQACLRRIEKMEVEHKHKIEVKEKEMKEMELCHKHNIETKDKELDEKKVELQKITKEFEMSIKEKQAETNEKVQHQWSNSINDTIELLREQLAKDENTSEVKFLKLLDVLAIALTVKPAYLRMSTSSIHIEQQSPMSSLSMNYSANAHKEDAAHEKQSLERKGGNEVNAIRFSHDTDNDDVDGPYSIDVADFVEPCDTIDGGHYSDEDRSSLTCIKSRGTASVCTQSPGRVMFDGGEEIQSSSDEIDQEGHITEAVAEKFAIVARRMLELGFQNQRINPYLKGSITSVMSEIHGDAE